MSLSVFDIAKNISWTEEKKIYLLAKDSRYELLVEYLNSGTVEYVEEDIKILRAFQTVLRDNNKTLIENYIMTELEGFSQYADGFFAHIAGAHDLSPSIQYGIEDNSISIKHPNLPHIERLKIPLETLIDLLLQTKKLKDCFNSLLKTPEK